MKEITPYFLKIHGLYAALDVLNKVWTAFWILVTPQKCGSLAVMPEVSVDWWLQVLRDYAVDSVASIACSCMSIHEASTSVRTSTAVLRLVSDAVISWLLISLSGVTMMCQAVIYSVVVNSGENSIVALLIATKLLEVKGIVYKRFDERKLLDMARMVCCLLISRASVKV